MASLRISDGVRGREEIGIIAFKIWGRRLK